MSKRRRKSNESDIIWVFALIGVLCYIKTKNKVLAIGVFIASIAIYFISLYLKGYKKKKKYLNSGINVVDKMEGTEFEEFLLVHFENLGYKGKLTPKTNDYGADLILSKEEEKIVVQAKRYTNKVGIDAVQEIIGAKSYYKADSSIVITNNYFTKNAINLANSSNVELWDRRKLIEIMIKENWKKELDDKLNVKITDKDRICKVCGSNMVKRNGKYGAFYGCSNYPKCKYNEKIK